MRMHPEANEAVQARSQSDQFAALESVRQIQQRASELRRAASAGRYGDEELKRFWNLLQDAPTALRVDGSKLGERAGLGKAYFSSVVAQRRRPRLENFLKALNAVEDIASERLPNAWLSANAGSEIVDRSATSRIQQDYSELLIVAISHARMAHAEVRRLENERPNDPKAIEYLQKQRELLMILASGFDRIASALIESANKATNPSALGKIHGTIRHVGREVEAWVAGNSKDVVDSTLRISQFAAGVAVLNLAGAEMMVATPVVAGLVGGSKVLEILKRLKRPD